MNYDDAVNFKRNRRNMEPATYNARRLLEHPIPSVDIEAEQELNSNNSSFESVEADNTDVDVFNNNASLEIQQNDSNLQGNAIFVF